MLSRKPDTESHPKMAFVPLFKKCSNRYTARLETVNFTEKVCKALINRDIFPVACK